jgi:hypothetical protein
MNPTERRIKWIPKLLRTFELSERMSKVVDECYKPSVSAGLLEKKSATFEKLFDTLRMLSILTSP